MRASLSLRKLATRITKQRPPQTIRVVNGTVATVTAGAAADGNAAVFVTVGSDTVPAPYADAYSPAVGHMVRVLLVDGSPFILGRVIGLPVI